jgi:GTP pyrophosphokinase
MIRIEEILEAVAEYRPEADFDLLRRAYVYSAKVHKGQRRKSGEPYLAHPLEVMNVLARLRLDVSSLAAGLLHDTVEDSALASIEEIRDLFGAEIAELVDAVTKISRMTFSSQAEKQAENFKKIILATAKDIRVILIKLADRLHNMRTLDSLTAAQQKRIAMETIEIYAPLAHRMGINWVKSELEDLCFRTLQPEAHDRIEQSLRKDRREREKYIEEVIAILENLLRENGIAGRVLGRVKNHYGIYKKMQAQSLEFEQVHDLTAFRVVVGEVHACYEMLGIVHSLWTPVPGRFKDYVALPKENMYQSLHTTVVGPGGQRIEIQIRTEEMHKMAEEGIAAHWAYKEGRRAADGTDAKFAWLRQLLEWRAEMDDPEEFLDSVKFDLFPNEVYVFTPKGDVIALPKGSTPIDFAYRIHSEVGSHCVGARANGVMVPLKYELQHGEHIEILTSKTQTPSRDWLKIAKTGAAKAKIRAFIRKEEATRSAQLGRSILDKELRKFKLTVPRLEKDGRLRELAEKVGVGSTEDALYQAIGFGKVLPANLIAHLVPEAPEPPPAEKPPTPSLLQRVFRARRSQGSGILIKGVDDVMVRMGKCCAPVPGEPIVGFITRGRGVTIHQKHCPEVQFLEVERKIDVAWDEAATDVRGTATIQIYSTDTQGLLADVTKAIAAAGGDVKRMNVETTEDRHANHVVDLEVKNIGQLQAILRAIEKIKGVLRVERL